MSPDRTPDTGLPSEKAVEAAYSWTAVTERQQLVIREALAAAHDPALGLDRSVRLRAVVEALRESAAANGVPLAAFIERHFTEAHDA
jgi:hypothetical protein